MKIFVKPRGDISTEQMLHPPCTVCTYSIFFQQFHCCLGQAYYDKTTHILCHYIGGTPQMLREELKTFINGNTRWIHDACSEILALRNMKVEDFCNSLVEPGYFYDELAITVVCKMKTSIAWFFATIRFGQPEINLITDDVLLNCAILEGESSKRLPPSSMVKVSALEQRKKILVWESLVEIGSQIH